MTTTILRFHKAHYPVTVLGYGRRIGIWLQGCSIRCKKCVSQDTWEADGGADLPVSDLLAWCQTKAKDGLDGITISGGEPFDQPLALVALLRELDRWRTQSRQTFDLLCYSGYPYAALQARHADILALLDVVIPEPYVDSLPEGGCWRGSENQTLVPLSPLAVARYGQPGDAIAEKTMQLAVENGRVWMIGIPARNSMAALERFCSAQELPFEEVSWRG
jgi:anaerobic ribonucleoside-triphosphate reductase activating protein